jgi:CubicO group peptidase (beta-lactamase class C family)
MSEHLSDHASVCEEVGVAPERLARALALLDDWVIQGKVPGVAAVVIRRGRLIARHFRGLAAPGDVHRPICADTIFPLASISKPVVALAFMMLVESGDVVLDDPVSTYIPEFGKGGKESMRVRHLLTHSSGLPDMPANNEALRKAHSGLPSFVRAVAKADLAYTPGTRVVYSSMAFLILGEILERVTGKSVTAFVAERVLAPLGLASTCFRPDEALYPRIAELRLLGGRKATNWDNNSAYWRQLGAPWGGLYATADDLARLATFVLGVLGGTRVDAPAIVCPATLRLMATTHTRGVASVTNVQETWGLGWAMPAGWTSRWAGDLCSPETFGHHGAMGSLLWMDPARDLACAVLTNQVTHFSTDWRRFGAFSNALQASVVR